jgi:AAA15 family ATPase/GTPase
VTHDTNLLDARSFRRDQIWFVEKDAVGGSHLYSLAEFKGVGTRIEEDYIAGRYGAVPLLGDLRHVFGAGGEGPASVPGAEEDNAGAS